MPWQKSWRADPKGAALADRHYNRQKIGHPQFVPPGRCFVLVSECAQAVWVTSWPFSKYVKHAWAGAWVNSIFRNEGAGLSSELIRNAVAHSLAHWPDVPPLGIVSFVDAAKTRAKRNPGYCYLRAGFEYDGKTKSGLIALRMAPAAMPPAMALPDART